MKILFFARRFYPQIGGVEKHVFEISKRLVAKGHSVTIITEEFPGFKQNNNLSAKEMGIIQQFTILKIPISSKERQKKFEIWKWLWNNRTIMQQADVIHCHDVFFWYLPFRFLYPHKKAFTTFHGYEEYPITRKAILVRKLSEILSVGNICIGDFIKKWYGTRPDIVSYGAVDSLQLKVKSLQFNKESAVFFGRLDEQTGIKTYLDGYKITKKDHPKFALTVVGDGPQQKYLTKDIIHHPFDPKVEKYLSKHRFAFVSRYLSILEAMAAKRLVFAVFDNPIKRDYLKMSPMARFMVITDSPEELAETVKFYLNHPKNEQDHVTQAYNFAKEQTWEKMVDNYLRLWKK